MTTLTPHLAPAVGPRDVHTITRLHSAAASRFVYDETRLERQWTVLSGGDDHVQVRDHDEERSW
jgi:hypothetical protein